MENKKRKEFFLLLFLSLFLISSPVLGASQVAEIPPLIGEEEPLVKEEPRDQDLLVPTIKGVQQATKKEFDKVKELEKKTTDELIGSYLVGDYSSGEILMAKEADKVVGLASTSKLMTIYLVMDAVESGRIKMSDRVTIDKEASSLTGSTYKTKENEVYTVEELIHAGLVVSGNDAMIALAKHISGSQEAFVNEMNQKAKDLGLTNAHFINVHGLTDYVKNDYNQMTTSELFILARNLIQDYPEVIGISQRTVINEEGRNFLCYNTNPLLGIVPEVDGLKTGYTNAAGRCLVATSLTKDQGAKKATRLIGVFMNSAGNWERFVGTKRVMEEAIERFSYETIANPKKDLDTLSLKNASPNQVLVYPEKPKMLLLDSGKYFHKEIEYFDLKLPIKKGGKVGKVKYFLEDDLMYETNLIVKEEIRKPNIILHIKDQIRLAFQGLDAKVAQR